MTIDTKNRGLALKTHLFLSTICVALLALLGTDTIGSIVFVWNLAFEYNLFDTLFTVLIAGFCVLLCFAGTFVLPLVGCKKI